VLQVPLREVQAAEATAGIHRIVPAAFHRRQAEGLLPVPPALGEGPEITQGEHQQRPRIDPRGDIGRASLPVHRLHAPAQQLGRSTVGTDGIVCLPQAKGCLPLQGAVAERGREFEGLLARCNGGVEFSCHHELLSHRG
jgi:hypothetical protein